MGKAKRLLTLGKMSLRNPRSYVSATKFLVKYGYIGLREKLYQEVLVEEGLRNPEELKTGSVSSIYRFAVLVNASHGMLGQIERTIDSIKKQVYANWELVVLARDQDVDRACIENMLDDNISVSFFDAQAETCEVLNTALSNTRCDYYLSIKEGDTLHSEALLEVCMCINNTKAEILYCDQTELNTKSKTELPFCKPDWSPDLLLAQMYLGRFVFLKKNIVVAEGGYREGYGGSEDYDLLLRLSARSYTIAHVDKILGCCVSSELPLSQAAEAQVSALRAIQEHLDACMGSGAAQVSQTEDMFVYDIRYRINEATRASIIIPTKDHIDDLKKAIDSIFDLTEYPNFEIIVLNNNSEEEVSYEYFSEITKKNKNIRVENAFYEFNWSKLNNHGISLASGDVFVCLNNDVVVLEGDWLTRLVENAMRNGVGVVGGLLLYPDQTIQHAGVVVGMSGWADHVFKGMEPRHCGTPFVSPLVTRNVSAVTGACMAFSRDFYENVGGFNEEFVVCGSDVEICIRAMNCGYQNVYSPYVRLMHYESKSRDVSKTPEIDYRLSDVMYRTYRETGDPYYNNNLDYSVCVPALVSRREMLRRRSQHSFTAGVDEARPLKFRSVSRSKIRINLLIPSVNSEDIFGGISTAVKFYETLIRNKDFDARILVMDGEPRVKEALNRFPEYVFVDMDDESESSREIVSVVSRYDKTLPVSEKDWFVFTSWWSAYCVQQEYENWNQQGLLSPNPFLYLIQDYEPGFYPWSSRYVLAELTYRCENPQIAIFNSRELETFFRDRNYSFYESFVFSPLLNEGLKRALIKTDGRVAKRRQILIYGRPGVPRNAFELAVEALRLWVDGSSESASWEFVSAGEKHLPVFLGKGKYLVSVGKQSIEGYAKLLAESYAGISLMVSPHPSYPPLEMAAFGVKVVTNGYEGKNLESFSPCIKSLSKASPQNIANALETLCKEYKLDAECGQVPESYLKNEEVFRFVRDLQKIILGFEDN